MTATTTTTTTTAQGDVLVTREVAELMALAVRSVKSDAVVLGAPYYADRDTFLVHNYNALCPRAIDDVNHGHELSHSLTPLLAWDAYLNNGFDICSCVHGAPVLEGLGWSD